MTKTKLFAFAALLSFAAGCSGVAAQDINGSAATQDINKTPAAQDVDTAGRASGAFTATSVLSVRDF